MTNKYYYVRRAVWEHRHNKKQKSFRSFQKMRKLFKGPMWLLFILMLICDFLFGYILYSSINDWFGLIPFTAMFIIFTLADTLPESTLYNMTEREKEINEENYSITKHLNSLIIILTDLNVIASQQRLLLKSECEMRIKSFQDSINRLHKKIFYLLIVIPSIAVIQAIVTNKSTNMKVFVIILCIGFFIMYLSRVLSPIYEIWNGTNKDKALLDELNELEYYDK